MDIVDLPTGNLYNIAIEFMTVEIVDFPMKKGDFPQLC